MKNEVAVTFPAIEYVGGMGQKKTVPGSVVMASVQSVKDECWDLYGKVTEYTLTHYGVLAAEDRALVLSTWKKVQP